MTDSIHNRRFKKLYFSPPTIAVHLQRAAPRSNTSCGTVTARPRLTAAGAAHDARSRRNSSFPLTPNLSSQQSNYNDTVKQFIFWRSFLNAFSVSSSVLKKKRKGVGPGLLVFTHPSSRLSVLGGTQSQQLLLCVSNANRFI